MKVKSGEKSASNPIAHSETMRLCPPELKEPPQDSTTINRNTGTQQSR
jgi:hypothetical protein